MIHIDDIKQRLKINKEPKEVKQMRKHILNSFKNLEFIEEGHKYFIHNEDGTVDNPISVSGLVKEFEVEVDWDAKAQGVANREGVDISVIKRKWKEKNITATNSGSLHHLFGEQLMKLMIDPKSKIDPIIKPQFEEGFLIPSAPKQEAIVKYWEDIIGIDEMYPLIPEVKMYMPLDNKFGIKRLYCGTADITFAIKYKGEWSILIHDYKTNASLTSDYARSFEQYMLEPFNDMFDESLGHYTVQLSLYQMMLMNLGYKIIDRKLIWLKNDGNYEKVSVPDVTQKLIEYYSK